MDHEGQDDVSPYSNLPLLHDACLECAWKCLFIKEPLNAMKDALEPLCPRGVSRCASRGLNDLIGDFLRDTGTAPEGTLWRTSGMLAVYVPPRDYILALKLFAGRPKDREDIASLCQLLHIQTRAQAQQLVDRYIPNKQVQQLNHLDDTLDEWFP